MLWANFRLDNVAHVRGNCKRQWLIIHREHEGFTEKKTGNTAGGKLHFSGRGTEGIRGLGDSWDAISLASYFLTADRGL